MHESFDASRIPTLAATAAARMGDPRPTLIQHSRGTREAANLLASGDVIQGSQANMDVYLIAMQGRFRARANDPLSATPVASATYSVMYLVVDAATGQIVDSGMAKTYPRLASLGPVITDVGAGPTGPG